VSRPRFIALVATALVIVALGVVFALRPTALPAGKLAAMGGPWQCRQAALQVTSSGLTVQDRPAVDSASIVIETRAACPLTGPLRLQVRGADGNWTAVPSGPTTAGALAPHHLGNTGPQTATTLHLTPPTTYLVDMAWERETAGCTDRAVRLVGPALALPIPSLPGWCGQPVAVSNTFAASVTYSVRWVSAGARGNTLAIKYQPQCRGARAVVTETSRSVTVAVVTVRADGPGGCMKLGFDLATLRTTLQAPLGNRKLLHAKVGPWPAITP
jgi:hypothetical protein